MWQTRTVFVVAILELVGTVDAEAAPLAADLGATVYEARLALSAPPPTVVLTTPDRARATVLLASIRARGHGAVACDAAAVTASDAMTSLRRFRFDDDALVTDAGERLPFGDVLVLVLAQHRVHVDRRTEHSEKRFDMTRAIVSGGLVVRKAVTTSTHTTADERERVLYLFCRDGAPWVLRENDASYAALGRVAPTVRENFDATVALLRARAQHAPFDARLLATRRVPEALRSSGDPRAQTLTTSTASGMDLLAHLLAMWLAKGGRKEGA